MRRDASRSILDESVSELERGVYGLGCRARIVCKLAWRRRINNRTAKAIGVTIPPSLLSRALNGQDVECWDVHRAVNRAQCRTCRFS